LKISLAPQSITCDTGKINKENMAKIHGKIVEQKGKKFHETQKVCNEAVEWVGVNGENGEKLEKRRRWASWR